MRTPLRKTSALTERGYVALLFNFLHEIMAIVPSSDMHLAVFMQGCGTHLLRAVKCDTCSVSYYVGFVSPM